MRTMNKKRLAAVAGGTAIVMAGAGIGYAYWTTSGIGDGSASTGTSQAVTVAQDGTTTGLVPDGAAQNISFSVTNLASFKQYVHNVTITIENPNGSPWSSNQVNSDLPACTANDFSIVQPSNIDAELDGNSTTHYSGAATIQLVDVADANQDNCKGVTVPLHFSANAS